MIQHDEELQKPLVTANTSQDDGQQSSSKIPSSWARRRVLVVLAIVLSSGVFVAHCCSAAKALQKSHHHSKHGHVNYQATLQPNNQIEYAREFTAPCDYGILVFNVGPAANYLPFQYDIYQDAYVFSNNKKLCWAYPTYRGIQKGPFPWWIQGDPTSFDVPTGKAASLISHRVVRPVDSKNITAHKGGDYLIMAHHKFYTPLFYENLKRKINSWTDDGAEADFGDLFASNAVEKIDSEGAAWEQLVGNSAKFEIEPMI